MGVSIQVYRCRIGSFQPRTRSHCSRRSSSTCPSSSSQCPGWAWSTFMFIVLSTLLLLQQNLPVTIKPDILTTSSTSALGSVTLQPLPCSWSPAWPPPEHYLKPALALLLTACLHTHCSLILTPWNYDLELFSFSIQHASCPLHQPPDQISNYLATPTHLSRKDSIFLQKWFMGTEDIVDMG